jgi:adenine-specific DNA-methyltransferase
MPRQPKSKIHEKGQYFTTNAFLKESVRDLVLNDPERVLEPSVGRGDLVEILHHPPGINYIQFDMYEIDTDIEMLDCVNTKNLIYGDFLEQEIERKYKTIVGNPPYVKTTTGNLYLDFVRRCHGLLEDGGELVFIVPSDFLKLTSASSLLAHMMATGTFTHIIRPNDEGLFEHASIDVIVFRYCLDPLLDNTVIYNGEPKRLIETSGILTFAPMDAPVGTEKLGDYFDVFVGMVSGRECVFKNAEFGTMGVRNSKDAVDKYIMVGRFPTGDAALDAYLLENKSDLLRRKIRRFSETNWFEWGALRNYGKVGARLGEECVYVSTLTRSAEVAFVGTVEYFGGGLLALIPKADAPRKLEMGKVAAFLNSAQFRENYLYSGRFKIGHRQLSNCLLNGV